MLHLCLYSLAIVNINFYEGRVGAPRRDPKRSGQEAVRTRSLRELLSPLCSTHCPGPDRVSGGFWWVVVVSPTGEEGVPRSTRETPHGRGLSHKGHDGGFRISQGGSTSEPTHGE